MQSDSASVEKRPDARSIVDLLTRYHALLGRARLYGLVAVVCLLALLVVLMGSPSHWMHKLIWTSLAAVFVIVRVAGASSLSRLQSRVRFERVFVSSEWTDRQLRRSGREENLWMKSSLYQALRRRQMGIPGSQPGAPRLRLLRPGRIDPGAMVVGAALIAHLAVAVVFAAQVRLSGVLVESAVAGAAFVIFEAVHLITLRRCRAHHGALGEAWAAFCDARRDVARPYRHTEDFRQVSWLGEKQKGANPK